MKLKYLLGLLPLLCLASCNSSKEDDGDLVCLDIVTLESNSDAGSVFSLQQSADSPVLTLISTQQLDPNTFKAGTRVVMQYVPANNQPYTSGNIRVIVAANTLGGGKAAEISTAEETTNWASAKVEARSIWRTGKYLNFQFQGDSSGDPRNCRLVFDESTLDSDFPVAHFIFNGSQGGMSQTYVFYASFDISKEWNLENAKGIKVVYKDMASVTTGDTQETFVKSTQTLTPN